MDYIANPVAGIPHLNPYMLHVEQLEEVALFQTDTGGQLSPHVLLMETGTHLQPAEAIITVVALGIILEFGSSTLTYETN
ncbi:hypothetical protein [Chromobacterium sp. CV08]|uniref:hypothetical protein n=1 Tax=Chromobacterium sp. CV08 TaxID=3133274 RepID=UPI003DA8DD1C